MEDRALGCDISHWQDDNNTPEGVDFADMVQAGGSFVFIKSTQGTGIVDSDFVISWDNAKSEGLLRGAYLFYDERSNPVEQAHHFYNKVNETGDLGELPPVVDVELDFTGDGSINGTTLRTCVETVGNLFGTAPLIYTSKYRWSLVTNYLDPAWVEYPLWVAQYPYDNSIGPGYFEGPYLEGIHHDEPNLMPGGWLDWEFWQFTSKGRGSTWGAESNYIDLNCYVGTVFELLDMYGTPGPVEHVRVAGNPPNVFATATTGKRVGLIAQSDGPALEVLGPNENGRTPVKIWVPSGTLENA